MRCRPLMQNSKSQLEIPTMPSTKWRRWKRLSVHLSILNYLYWKISIVSWQTCRKRPLRWLCRSLTCYSTRKLVSKVLITQNIWSHWQICLLQASTGRSEMWTSDWLLPNLSKIGSPPLSFSSMITSWCCNQAADILQLLTTAKTDKIIVLAGAAEKIFITFIIKYE